MDGQMNLLDLSLRNALVFMKYNYMLYWLY